MLTAYKTIKNGYDYHLHVHLENYIIQDCNHSGDYHKRFDEDCCNSHRYRGQDIRKQLKRVLLNNRPMIKGKYCLENVFGRRGKQKFVI